MDIVRASCPGRWEIRDDGSAATPTLVGYFARFGEWTTIDSVMEGKFRERVAPGAFLRSFTEDRDRIRVLFQHGRDPQVGDKPLGPITIMREDAAGAWYEVPLLDTSYNRDLLPGLAAGLYGSSFRFTVTAEDFDPRPKRSIDNPEGIPERTIRAVKLLEMGPCTFPAYPGSTAGVRSMTDQFTYGGGVGS